jgi:hypothetical protein
MTTLLALLALAGGQEDSEKVKAAREKGLAQARAEGRPLVFLVYDTA